MHRRPAADLERLTARGGGAPAPRRRGGSAGGAPDGGADRGADGVAVAMLWPSVQTAMVFVANAHAARGTITKCERREVIEIDGKAAADVYVAWTRTPPPRRRRRRRRRAAARRARRYDAGAARAPRGRQRERPSHLLIHPETRRTAAAHDLADVEEGQELMCMSATSGDLVHLMLEATAAPDVADFCESLQGALAVMAAARSPSATACRRSRATSNTLGGKPFITMLTHGEQGVDLGGANGHGNPCTRCFLGAPKPTAPARGARDRRRASAALPPLRLPPRFRSLGRRATDSELKKARYD